MTENYDETIRVRVTAEQKKMFKREAKDSGMKESEYARVKLFASEFTIGYAPHDVSVPATTRALAAHTPYEQRLAAVETAISSTPEGSEALSAAQQAANLINRKDDK